MKRALLLVAMCLGLVACCRSQRFVPVAQIPYVALDTKTGKACLTDESFRTVGSNFEKLPTCEELAKQ